MSLKLYHRDSQTLISSNTPSVRSMFDGNEYLKVVERKSKNFLVSDGSPGKVRQ